MTEPSSPGDGRSPLRMGGFVMLGISAVAAVVGLVSLAGGDNMAASAVSAAPSAEPSVSEQPPIEPAPAMPTLAAPPPEAPAVPPPEASVVPPPEVPAAPPPEAPAPAPEQVPNTSQPGDSAPPPAAAPSDPPEAPSVQAAPGGAPGGGGEVSSAPQALPGAGLPEENKAKAGGTGKQGIARVPVRVYNNSLIKNLARNAAEDFRASGWTVTEVGNYSQGIIPTSTVYYREGTEEQTAAQELANAFGLRAAPRFPGIANASPGLIVIVTKDYQRR